MKILYYQDSHGSGSNSLNRLTNYYKDWLHKIEEVHLIAKEQKCELIIHGGDVWENPIVSNLMVDDFIDIVEKTKIPMRVVWGNHDEICQNIKTSNRSSLAHCFRRSNLIESLDPIGSHKENPWFIHPYHYEYGIEENIKKHGLLVDCPTNKDYFKIAIVHGFICPKIFPFASHIVCDDINTNADLVLVGHYHAQWEKKVGKTQYVDIGCLGRLNINEHNINPSILIINTQKRNYEIIQLKSAKPGSEIFDLTKAKEAKDYKKNINNFITSLQETKITNIDIKDMIAEVCKKQKIKNNVKQLIFNILDQGEMNE